MLTDAFTSHVLDQFKRTTSSWAQLHVGDPGEDGSRNCSIDRRRVSVRWNMATSSSLVADNALVWQQVQGIPGFPETICYISLWSEAENGMCWAMVPLTPVTVPNLATLEIPIGLTISLDNEGTDQ